MSVESSIIFIVVSLMVLYRTVDLYCTQAKISQLIQRYSWFEDRKLSFGAKRTILLGFGSKARTGIILIKWLAIVNTEFLFILMIIYISILSLAGLTFILVNKPDILAAILVACSTAIISLFGSYTNFLIEKIKLNFKY